MSKRNLIFLILFLILITLSVFFYLRKNKPEPVVPATNTESAKIEEINTELTTPVVSPSSKTPKVIQKINTELQSSEVIPPGTPTKEEINNSLTE